MTRRAVVLAIGLLGAARPLLAQSPDSLVAAGVRAYGNLSFATAAGYLRRALMLLDGRADTTTQAEALVYLGATEIFRQRADSAASAFAQLVRLDPRYRIDALTFPPEVTSVFDATRRSVRATAIALPARTRFRAGEAGLVGSVFASSFHEVRIEVQAPDGSVIRRLYAGALGDSLAISWDGRMVDGSPVVTGHYLLAVTSLGPVGVTERILRVPLDVTSVPVDTLPTPPTPSFLPQEEARTGSVGSLVTGLAMGTAIMALPTVVAPDASLGPGRFLVGSALSIGGVFGFFKGRGTHTISENVAVNDSLRTVWQTRQRAVAAENIRRRLDAEITVRRGTPQVIERERP